MEIIINNVIDASDLDMSTMDGSSVVWLNDRLYEPQTMSSNQPEDFVHIK